MTKKSCMYDSKQLDFLQSHQADVTELDRHYYIQELLSDEKNWDDANCLTIPIQPVKARLAVTSSWLVL